MSPPRRSARRSRARDAVPAATVYLQERHVAQAFQEAAFAQVGATKRAGVLRRLLGVECTAPDDPVAVQNQVRSQLMKAGKPAFVEESVPERRHGLRVVLRARRCAVLPHPG